MHPCRGNGFYSFTTQETEAIDHSDAYNACRNFAFFARCVPFVCVCVFVTLALVRCLPPGKSTESQQITSWGVGQVCRGDGVNISPTGSDPRTFVYLVKNQRANTPELRRYCLVCIVGRAIVHNLVLFNLSRFVFRMSLAEGYHILPQLPVKQPKVWLEAINRLQLRTFATK